MSAKDKMLARMMWLLPNGLVQCIWINQRDYERCSGVSFDSLEPVNGSKFLMAVGGIPLSQINNHWMEYRHETADDPLNRGWSNMVGIIASSKNARPYLIHRITPNHHSVTFDTFCSTTSSSATSVDASLTMSSAANGYIGASIYAGANIVSITYGGQALSSRLDPFSSVHFWDKVAPLSGTNLLTFTIDSATAIVCGGQSATGVHQVTPVSASNTNSGNSSVPTVSVASVVGELVLSQVNWNVGAASNLTIDGTWVSDFNIKDPGNNICLGAAHIAGAASITRTDSLDGSVPWAAMIVSLQAVAEANKVGSLLLMYQ